MEDNMNMFESLYERATDYGKTSLELMKLKAVEKTSDVVSSFVPHSIVLILFVFFLIFFNLGLAFWLGEILGNTYYGFFIVAGFYGLIGIVVRFFMFKWLKRLISDNIVKMLLK